jgi:hypothetical protein
VNDLPERVLRANGADAAPVPVELPELIPAHTGYIRTVTMAILLLCITVYYRTLFLFSNRNTRDSPVNVLCCGDHLGCTYIIKEKFNMKHYGFKLLSTLGFGLVKGTVA